MLGREQTGLVLPYGGRNQLPEQVQPVAVFVSPLDDAKTQRQESDEDHSVCQREPPP